MSKAMTLRLPDEAHEIEAMHWDGDASTAQPIIQWINATESTATYIGVGEPHSGRQTHMLDEYHVAPLKHGGFGHRRVLNEDAPAFLSIRTLEGYMRADAGDWIIRGGQGDFYPCRPTADHGTRNRLNGSLNE